MGSGSGTYDLAPESPEPIASRKSVVLRPSDV
jgi:hypothetical protein